MWTDVAACQSLNPGAVVSAINRISTAPPATWEQYWAPILQVVLLSHPRKSSSNRDKQDYYCSSSYLRAVLSTIPAGSTAPSSS